MFFEGDGFDTELRVDNDNGFLQKSRSGAFAPQLGFHSSDPYRDASDAMRAGVPMAEFGWPSQMQKPSNDFYCDDDDVVRGCSIAQAPGLDSLFSKPSEDDMASGFFNSFMPQTFGMPLKDGAYSLAPSSSVALQGSARPLRFQQDDVPPAPPNTAHFNFEATSLFITTNEVHNVANGILDFLDSQVIASVHKVRQRKYSIKVDLFLDHIMCTTKIRIWKMKSKHNHYAIEFQRRGGDPFAFGDGYRRCIDFLVLQFPEISERSIEANGTEKQRSMPPPPPAPVDSNDRSEEELDVELFTLLDFAGMHQFPNLQAEAAQGLAKVACDDVCVAKYLSKFDVLDKLLPLLLCDSVEVVYPTARMLSAVAMHAASPIAEHSISKVLITKINDPKSNQLVRLELAKAVSAAVRNCPHLISTARAHNLQCLLESTLHDLPNAPDMDVVRSTLHDVLIDLTPYCYPACYD